MVGNGLFSHVTIFWLSKDVVYFYYRSLCVDVALADHYSPNTEHTVTRVTKHLGNTILLLQQRSR